MPDNTERKRKKRKLKKKRMIEIKKVAEG